MADDISAPTFNRLSVSPLTCTIGAEIEGVDLREALSDEVIAEIRRALVTWKVIFFRDQDVTQAQHIAFGRRFGEVEVHPAARDGSANPEILRLHTGPDLRGQADAWHSDVSWRERPPLGSILIGRVIPEVGGDTLFSDMVAAYEGLSPAMKAWVCTLICRHDAVTHARQQGKTLEEFQKEFPAPEHPVVRTLPETGQRALYVNRGVVAKRILGLSPKESDWLVEHLSAQASNPEYQCRFRWRKNSIAFWHDASCQHFGTANYFPAVRQMERVTVMGDKPFFDPDR